MREAELFSIGLGVVSPWKIVDLEFVEGDVHVYVDFERGSRFEGLAVHDTLDKTWRHLSFFKYPCIVHARVPRVKHEDGSVRMVQVPWGNPGSGFTVDFEKVALSLMRQMPVLAVARELKVHDTMLWRMLRRSVKDAWEAQNIGTPQKVGVDETASRRGHHYITVFVDLDARRVLFACEGRSGDSLKQFRAYLSSKGLSPNTTLEFVSDMSPAFLSGIAQSFPKARVTLDKFHLVALLTKAVDDTRKEEARGYKQLHGTRWLWLKNPSNLTVRQREELKAFLMENDYCKTARAYGFKTQFQELFLLNAKAAERLFDAWLDRALESGLTFIETVATTLFKARELVLNWFQTRISNGVLEGLHSVLQAAKNKARGYRNPQNLIAMSYLLHGKLDAFTHTI